MAAFEKKLIDNFLQTGKVVSVFSPTSMYHALTLRTIKALLETGGGIYVTATRPASVIIKELNQAKVDYDDLFLVDCISYTVGGEAVHPRTVFLESPTMLESVLLNVDLLMRRVHQHEHRFVFFDSINSLTIYADLRMLQEFVHIFASTLQLKGIYPVLFTVEEQTPKEIENILRLISDETMGQETWGEEES